jgi:hypothetical protein
MRRVSSACPSAVQFFDMWIEKLVYKHQPIRQVFIRMELCGQSLQALFDDGALMSEQQVWHILEQVRVHIP